MPRVVQSKRIWWEAVAASDLVGYKVYWAKAPADFSYDLPNVKEVSKETTEIIVPVDLPAEQFEQDVNYNIWVTSVDDQGNESDPLLLVGQFDFTPPPKPATGGVEDLF